MTVNSISQFDVSSLTKWNIQISEYDSCDALSKASRSQLETYYNGDARGEAAFWVTVVFIAANHLAGGDYLNLPIYGKGAALLGLGTAVLTPYVVANNKVNQFVSDLDEWCFAKVAESPKQTYQSFVLSEAFLKARAEKAEKHPGTAS